MSTLMIAAALAAAATEAPCNAREIVERFYVEALVEKRVRSAFEQYVDADFVEHKPDIATADREGAIAYLGGLVAELPEARWEVLRVTGDGSLVAVHARFTPAEGAEPYAVADFFRVEACRIVEHWDVVGPPRANMPNPLSRF